MSSIKFCVAVERSVDYHRPEVNFGTSKESLKDYLSKTYPKEWQDRWMFCDHSVGLEGAIRNANMSLLELYDVKDLINQLIEKKDAEERQVVYCVEDDFERFTCFLDLEDAVSFFNQKVKEEDFDFDKMVMIKKRAVRLSEIQDYVE